MQREFTFNICSVVILIILLFSLFSRKMTKGRSNKIFIWLVVISLVTSISDILRWIIPVGVTESSGKLAFSYFFQCVYYLSKFLTSTAYFMYILSSYGLWAKLNENKKLMVAIHIVPVLVILTVFQNLFTHTIFYIDNTMTYYRAAFFPLLVALSYSVVLVSIIVVCRYKILFKRIEFITVLLFYPATMVASLLHLFHPKFLLEPISITFAIFAVSLIIHCPSEKYNMDTETYGFNAYVQDLERNFILNIPTNLIFIHIDNYKQLKRQFNVNNYNELLRLLVKEMGQALAGKTVDIYNLDNCIFVLNCHQAKISEVSEIANKIQNYFKNAHFKKMSLYLETTICIVKCPEELSDVDKIISFSNNFFTVIDKKNVVTFLNEESKTLNFKLRTEIDEIIKRAITYGKFEMYYQPIYSVEKGQFTSAEALIRLKDDDYGFISPGLFIPAAEASGAIHQIGDFVIENVCHCISTHNLEKLGLEYIELNLSVAQCIEQNFAEKLIGILQKNNVSSDKINLEITETAADVDHEVTSKNINVLSNHGLTFSLDDYGTGYSNVKRVTSMPLSIIKLDKTFVDEYLNDDMKIVIKRTVDMFKKMNKHILVEGIEEKAALEHFIDLGCDYIQGFYFSKPLPETEFIRFLREKNKRRS